MAVKTITIDLEAYNLLALHKKEGESFSQVIKAHFGPRQLTVGRFRERMKEVRLTKEFLDAVNQVVRDRQLEPARGPKP
jgi:predicted CopG family antitoxin